MGEVTGGVRRKQSAQAGAHWGALLAWAVLLVVAAGVLLRSLRLSWQPLWWDEGYSIYFASESLARMAWLTARDIHPPLYYALLNFWMEMVSGRPTPESGRLLSVLFGALALPLQYFLARALFPNRGRLALLALLLLAFSPLHLYYSQEVRMYGLALALGLASSLALWRWLERIIGSLRLSQSAASSSAPHASVQAAQARVSPAHPLTRSPAYSRWALIAPALAYLLAGLAALYTLYYAALLLAAHAIWAVVRLRHHVRALLGLLGVYLLMFLLYLPWLLYAVPQLIGYVGGKVQSDQDSPLGPLAYVERHLVAFTAGHVQLASLPAEWLALAPATLAICAIILGFVLRQTLRTSARASTRSGGRGNPSARAMRTAEPHAPTMDGGSDDRSGAIAALWTWLLVPVVLGWLINLRLPFFPTGGERLLLIVLPYFLLLLAYGVERTWNVLHLGKLAAAALAVNAALGVSAYFTTPRYVADDYRALLQQVHQQGADDDTLLAIFPWQVGYWRAYAPTEADALAGPQPLLLSDTAAAWSPAVAASIDAALQQGTVWFPEPLTFGSSLPHEIEQYLAQQAVNRENRWYDATRLTAWARLPAPATQPIGADFGLVRLQEAGIAPAVVASANQTVAATLVWAGGAASGLESGSSGAADSTGLADGGSDQAEINVSLRVQDEGGHVWASREYAQRLPAAGMVISETVGLMVPAGLPPGGYQVAVSLQTASGAALTIGGSDASAAVIGELAVTQPEEPVSAVRLPIQRRLDRHATSAGLELLGYSGPGATSDADSAATRPLLAGTELAGTLFLTKGSSGVAERNVYLSLLDATGAGVAGYEGWPLPAYPTSAWQQGALTQVPVAFYLPGALASGDYRLVAGLLDPATGEKTPPVELATLPVLQRAASFSQPTPSQPLADPPQVGTHARLLGYDLAPDDAGRFVVTLYWEILQPLLPPHHIFVHLDAADGQTRAQQDGPPVTASGPAPTGSWQPGEFLTTQHILPATPGPGDILRVGLYNPQTQVRLPVTVNGQTAGDSVVLEPASD